MSDIEYAVQYKNYIGGPYDRLDTGWWANGNKHGYTQEQAESELEFYDQRWVKEQDPERPARIVTRVVSDWMPSPDWVVPSENAPKHVCLLDSPHRPHAWWYTSSGGGHMMNAVTTEDQKNVKEWWCPGV